MSKAEDKKIQAALDRFPEIVALKKKRYRERQAFLKKTFGPLVRELRAQEARDARAAKKK